MVAIEIMSRGKALIYTRKSAGLEIIEDKINGLLVDPKDIDEIADKMELLILNVDFRNMLGSNAIKKIKNNFSEKIIVDKLEQYYNSIINL